MEEIRCVRWYQEKRLEEPEAELCYLLTSSQVLYG